MNMEESRILIVEDDKDLSDIMKDYLMSEPYQIFQTDNGKEAIQIAKEINPTLVILDIMLPGTDGVEVCRTIRTYSHCPIIMISAKKSDSDKLLSLGLGADDYLTKPFSLIELLGRVKSHIRRFTTFESAKDNVRKAEKRIEFGALTIRPEAYLVEANGNEINFTSREFKLLQFMSSHPSQVFTKQQLLEYVWGETEFIDENTIAVYIGRIREKLAKEGISYIKTVWGVGYKWEV